MDGHAHHVAFFNWLLNNPAIEHVYSEMGALASAARVEDTGVTLIRTKGAIAEISGSNRLLEPNRKTDAISKNRSRSSAPPARSIFTRPIDPRSRSS